MKGLLELDAEVGVYEHLLTQAGDIYATINTDVGWAAVGVYNEKPMGGCDKIPTIIQIKAALELTVRYCLDTDYMIGVVFEGMMISTIKSTFYNFLLTLRAKYGAQIEPHFVILDTTLDGCVARITARGTKRAKLKLDNIAGKCEIVMRHAKEYDPSLVSYIKVEETARADMLPQFLTAVGDVDLLETYIVRS